MEHWGSSVMSITLEIWNLPFIKSITYSSLRVGWFGGGFLAQNQTTFAVFTLFFFFPKSFSLSCLFPYFSCALWTTAPQKVIIFSLGRLNSSVEFIFLCEEYHPLALYSVKKKMRSFKSVTIISFLSGIFLNLPLACTYFNRTSIFLPISPSQSLFFKNPLIKALF